MSVLVIAALAALVFVLAVLVFLPMIAGYLGFLAATFRVTYLETLWGEEEAE